MTPEPGARTIRKVTFLDATPDNPKQQPVTVCNELLLDDEPTDVRVNLRLPWSISCAGDDAVIVSFHVHPEDVTLGHTDTGDGYEPHRIGGRPVLSPKLGDWSTLHLNEPVDFHGEQVRDWVRVVMFAREAKVVAAS